MATNSPVNPFALPERTPLVSVIIPSYNKGAFLAEAVESIAAQTYPRLEIVVVDDGSSDDTLKVAQSLRKKHPNYPMQILSKPNGGISDARNYGIARCYGSVVCCLDADDIAAPTFIEKGIDAMQSLDANLVCCDVEIFGADSSEWIPDPYEPFHMRYNNCIPTLVLYHKKLWELGGGYSVALPFNEDWEFFIRLSKIGLKVHKIEEKLFRYRACIDGLANSYIKDSWDESVSLMIICNDSLYPVEQVLEAHKNISKMRESWFKRFEKQLTLHPDSWLLPFWLGLFHEDRRQLQAALDLYLRANQLAGGKNWQALYRIAALIEPGKKLEAASLLAAVREERPDMSRFVTPRIKAASESVENQELLKQQR